MCCVFISELNTIMAAMLEQHESDGHDVLRWERHIVNIFVALRGHACVCVCFEIFEIYQILFQL